MTTTKNIKSITIGDTTLPNNSFPTNLKILNGFNKIGLSDLGKPQGYVERQVRIEP